MQNEFVNCYKVNSADNAGCGYFLSPFQNVDQIVNTCIYKPTGNTKEQNPEKASEKTTFFHKNISRKKFVQ